MHAAARLAEVSTVVLELQGMGCRTAKVALRAGKNQSWERNDGKR